MKILLINPPFNIPKENYDSSVSVGLLSIASFLKSNGVGVEIIDAVRQKDFLNLISNRAKEYNLIGLSVMTMQISEALKISQLIRKINSQAKILWGGSHPTFFVKETIEHPLVDLVCFGEGEKVCLDLIQNKPFEEISGLAYKTENSEIKINPHQPLLKREELPEFNWNLVPEEILNHLYLIPSLTSRGCPHRCTFCINAILKNHWRAKSAEQVLHDLEIIKNRPEFQNKKIRFWDENFFVDIERAKKIISGMIERNLVMPWETTVRANYLNNDMIDDNLLKQMKTSGCYLLSFGAESGCPRILKKIKKDVDPEEILNSAKMALRHNIIPQYSFMIGLPGETRSDMHATLKLIDDLLKLSPKIQILGPQAFRPYPGSELYEECLQAGWQAPKNLDDWTHLIENQLNYLSVKNFPWVEDKDKDFVESMEAYVRFGAHSISSAMGSSVKAKKILKLGFVLLCQLRWKLKFFAWPIEFKLAKKFVSG